MRELEKTAMPPIQLHTRIQYSAASNPETYIGTVIDYNTTELLVEPFADGKTGDTIETTNLVHNLSRENGHYRIIDSL